MLKLYLKDKHGIFETQENNGDVPKNVRPQMAVPKWLCQKMYVPKWLRPQMARPQMARSPNGSSPNGFDDDKGTSLVLINSSKGESLFDAVKSNLRYKEVDIDEAVRYNSAAYKSAEKPKTRDKFMKEIMEDDFEKTVKKTY